jgi:chemotaxis protein CheZ
MAIATAKSSRPQLPAPEKGGAGANEHTDASDIQVLIRELATVAEYIARVKEEIGALRPNELCRDRIPSAHDELGSVVKATASATHVIMSAAEDILGAQEKDLAAYRQRVETRVLEIFEACSFQDITGQRISKVVDALGQLEKRLGRFATAIRVRDGEAAPDRDEAKRRERRETLMLNGPQAEGQGVNQGDIDKLFD